MHSPKINNKFHKHHLFLKDPELANLVPETKIFTVKNLFELINKHKKVILKPSLGSLGNGVIIVNKIGAEKFELINLNKKRYIKGENKLFRYLKSQETQSIPNIIQKYISLATLSHRSIDFRYIAQREKNDWVVTGKYAKVAKDGYAVTNFEHGATIFTVEDALKQSNLNNFNLEELLETLEGITLSISNCLSKTFTNHNIWGCDIGIDTSGKVWIIEANSAPQTKGFLELESLRPMHKVIEIYKLKNK